MELKRTAIVAVAAILALAVAWTAGRYTAPAKIVERERIVEKKVEVISQTAINEAVAKAEAEWKKNEKVREVIKTIYKEGKVVETVVYRDRDTSSSGSSSSSSGSTSTTNTTASTTTEVIKWKEKIVEAKKDRWRLSASASVPWNDFNIKTPADLVYEGRGEVRLVGGLWGGVTATPQHKLVGLTLSLQF